jgi:N-acetylglucosamine-6-sulfatase
MKLETKSLMSLSVYGSLTLLSVPFVQSCESKNVSESKQPNIVFILIDDQRHDFLSFRGNQWLKTPHIDKLAENSVYFENAFVTTSICSPSRASILTGMYVHAHTVDDNDTPLPADLPRFATFLQDGGYKTAFLGKYHMGPGSSPQPGFDQWLSFSGQGKFVNPDFNLNGDTFSMEGYMTDILTDYAVEFIKENVKNNSRYFLYLSHKAIHEDFTPAERHKGYYKDLIIPRPSTFENNEQNNDGKPDWVVKQRKSWHGSERENLGGFDTFFRRYSECMLAVDESVGRVVQTLKDLGELENTLIIYFSDNGYMMGEHGLIDKRVMYEESIRVPLFFHYPAMIKKHDMKKEFALNIDIGPTILDFANLDIPKAMHGKSLLPIIQNKEVEWRKDFLYEYFCDFNAVQTPTLFGLRTEQYSYIAPQGIWDKYELYDMHKDPEQKNNLLKDITYGQRYGDFKFQLRRQNPELYDIVIPMEERINEIIKETGGQRNASWKAY